MLSNTEIDALGRRLRDPVAPTPDDLAQYNDFRATYAGAPTEVEGVIGEIADTWFQLGPDSHSARLKAIDSVIRKLRRRSIRLSAMNDIAGCRLTLPSVAASRLARDLLQNSWNSNLEVIEVKDYLAKGKAGYRAIHVMLRARDDRPVEVQLRTRIQHAWANLSEKIAYRIDREIKAGRGPANVRRELERLSARGWALDSFQLDLEALGAPLQDARDATAADLRPDPRLRLHLRDLDDLLALVRVAQTQHERVTQGYIDYMAELDEVEATKAMTWILLKADHDTDEVELESFEERSDALEQLGIAEAGAGPNEEVVLFLADSVETLRRTRPRYFFSVREMAEQLRQDLERDAARARA